MKKKVEKQQKEEILCKIWGNAIWGGGVRIPVNIWGILMIRF